jgi:hypothetical protein
MRRIVLDPCRPPVITCFAMIQTHTGRRRYIGSRVALSTLALAFAAGCGSEEDDTVTGGDPTPTAAATTSAAATVPTKACPLVDTDLLPKLFTVKAPKLDEKDPVKSAGDVTTYSCDVSDGGDLFLTVGFAAAPPSGTAAANVKAALDGASGEPVTGVGEAGAFGAKDGLGTVAGVKTIDGKQVLLFVYGAADDKEQLVKVAQSAAGKL